MSSYQCHVVVSNNKLIGDKNLTDILRETDKDSFLFDEPIRTTLFPYNNTYYILYELDFTKVIALELEGILEIAPFVIVCSKSSDISEENPEQMDNLMLMEMVRASEVPVSYGIVTEKGLKNSDGIKLINEEDYFVYNELHVNDSVDSVINGLKSLIAGQDIYSPA